MSTDLYTERKHIADELEMVRALHELTREELAREREERAEDVMNQAYQYKELERDRDAWRRNAMLAGTIAVFVSIALAYFLILPK